MQVKYLGESDPAYFIKDHIYEVVGVEGDCFRIIDNTGEDFLYLAINFEIVEESTI